MTSFAVIRIKITLDLGETKMKKTNNWKGKKSNISLFSYFENLLRIYHSMVTIFPYQIVDNDIFLINMAVEWGKFLLQLPTASKY